MAGPICLKNHTGKYLIKSIPVFLLKGGRESFMMQNLQIVFRKSMAYIKNCPLPLSIKEQQD
ncbi:MAG TPA: hypothetical protein DD424_07065, partial [Porphyromonadaceae bacterium]|nr:hypothetical protein [Porphyromonadaceae bacterium]